ncbi:hypothetical protein BKA57DRAFT_234314 [Linnemannia elongata]|nr:hypothetical protein BKA57DRAFT_234314 [Linnemannia elongata]
MHACMPPWHCRLSFAFYLSPSYFKSSALFQPLPRPACSCTKVLHCHFASSSLLPYLPPSLHPLPSLTFSLSFLIALSLSLFPPTAGTKKAYLTQKGQQSNGKENIAFWRVREWTREGAKHVFFAGRKTRSRVLVVAGGITVLAVGTAVIIVATPALAVQASATAVTYALANGCLILKEVLSGIFSAGAIWYLWDYLRPCSSSSTAHRHRHESHLVPVQPYHTGWEPDSIALSPRPRTSFQSHHSQHRGRKKEDERKRGRGCSWSVLKVNKRIGEREERWAFRTLFSASIHTHIHSYLYISNKKPIVNRNNS